MYYVKISRICTQFSFFSDDCLIVLVYTEIIIFVAIFINYIPIWQYNTEITICHFSAIGFVQYHSLFQYFSCCSCSVSMGHSVILWSTSTFRYSSLKSSPLKQMTTRLFSNIFLKMYI